MFVKVLFIVRIHIQHRKCQLNLPSCVSGHIYYDSDRLNGQKKYPKRIENSCFSINYLLIKFTRTMFYFT